ncbi:MAG: tetratricopeptide repeat protein, partial [Alphaproteobacteria bacterium]|nr:tetratricopeptide repeat protein [Alphaproteobacteria bacterium]
MSDDLLFQEVDEEVRQEQYKKLWQRYGNYLMALCVVVVGAVAGFKGWEYWQVKQAEAAADVFLDAEKIAETDKAEDALARFAAVSHDGYGQLARLREASVLLGQEKTDEAVKIYDAIAADVAVD